jgi:hypothetical protein
MSATDGPTALAPPTSVSKRTMIASTLEAVRTTRGRVQEGSEKEKRKQEENVI